MVLAWDPLIPVALTVVALLVSAVIIRRAPDRSDAWKVRVLAKSLALVVAAVLVLTILDLLIPGNPFILLG